MGIKQGGVMMRRGLFLLGCVLFLAGGLCGAASAAVELRDMDFGRIHPQVRIKDIVDIEGARGNQLTGVGLVTGLAGTGDKSTMAIQMMRNMMRNFGVTLDEKAARTKNVAVIEIGRASCRERV